MDDDPKRPWSDDRDFLDRLSDLDRNLSVSGGERPTTGAEADAWDDFAERRRSSAAAPRGPRPLLDLFPPVAPDQEPVQAAPQGPPAASYEDFAAEKPPAGQEFEDLEDDPLDPTSSARRLAGLVVTFLLAMAAGATAAAYLFRDDLAAIFAAWQQTP